MTREQKIDMFVMRIDGYTLEDISQKYGISTERVRQILYHAIKDRQTKRRSKCVYPAIKKWMQENRITQFDMAVDVGISQANISQILLGKTRPSFEFCLYICEKTGLPIQEAFLYEWPGD